MLIIIFLLIAGSLLTYVAKYNLTPVTLQFGMYTISDIPLFYVITGSLLLGLILSYIFQLLSNVITYFQLRGKSREISSGKTEVLELTKRIHQLELENEKLRYSEKEVGDHNAL